MALSCTKKLSAVLRKIVSKHDGDLYCFNCLHSKQKLFENKDFFGVVVPSIDARILEFNQYQKSDEA